MRILWVATKPPWPPVDGGRLLMWNTLEGLRSAGHEVGLVAPDLGQDRSSVAGRELEQRLMERCHPHLVPARLRPRLSDALGAGLGRRAWTLHRHALPAVRKEVGRLAASGDWDVVHVEQVQAMAAVRDVDPGLPVLLRAQNVESDLWRAQVAGRSAPSAAWFRWQAELLARAEGAAVREVRLTAALTPEDAARLGALAAEGARGHDTSRVEVLPAPFQTELEPGSKDLGGEPPLVIFGSAGWRPNHAGAEWFVREIWPEVHRAHGSARLHLFGGELGGSAGTENHPAPASSQQALAAGSILVVPLHVASGVRMKILEAWARGVPVIATSVAASGLGATAGRELMVADDAQAFAQAVGRLRSPTAREAMIRAAREKLRCEHAPGVVAERLVELYGEARRIASTTP